MQFDIEWVLSWAPNLHEASVVGAKSQCVLLADVEVKANEVCFPYIKKWCDICHVLLCFEFFFHTVHKVRVKRS
jgi:hypothetical protein